MAILDSLFLLIGIILFLITLPGTVELLLVTSGAFLNYFFPIKKFTPIVVNPKKIIALIPAHNEEENIGHCIKTLQSNGFYEDVWVIADNCTDKTAEITKKSNAKLIERNDLKHRGKPYALRYAFEKLRSENFDIIFIVDADTVAATVSKKSIEDLFESGADGVQVQYSLYSSRPTFKSRFLSLAFQAFNYVRPFGRNYWNLSAGILGNGIALSRSTLDKVPFNTGSVVEDLEYHIKLVKAGLKVHFLETSNVQSEISAPNGEASQRARWEGGRLRLLCDSGLDLLKEIFKGKVRLIEPLLDLCLPPLSYYVLMIFILLFIPNSFLFDYALLALLILFSHGVITLLVSKATWKDFLAILAAPFYILWKVKIFSKIIEGAQKSFGWTRTDRK